MRFFSKKEKKQDDDPNASALFADRKGTPPSSSNPYASQPPPPSNNNTYTPPSKPKTQGGYGGQPYGQSPQPSRGNSYQGSAPASNPKAGYSGYGGAASNTNELFGNRQPNPNGPSANAYGRQPANPPPSYDDSSAGYSTGRAGNGGDAGGYSTGSRQLTAEEEEEEDVDAVKQEIRFTKQESVSSTRNALRVAAQAEETGRNALTKLGEQGERLYNTERNLDVAKSHNIVAEQRSRELKTVTGSMFAVHMKNPMKSKSRAQAEERKILERSQTEREEREANRAGGYATKNAVNNALKSGANSSGYPSSKASVQERSRYQFEGGDEEDDQMENEIDSNLTQLAGVTARLKGLAFSTGEEVDRQNKKIDDIMQKVWCPTTFGRYAANEMCRVIVSMIRSRSRTPGSRRFVRKEGLLEFACCFCFERHRYLGRYVGSIRVIYEVLPGVRYGEFSIT